MDFDSFLANFAGLFEDTPAEEITADTEFKYLDEWSSMSALTLVAMVEDEYDVTLTGEDIRNTDTVSELFELINKNK